MRNWNTTMSILRCCLDSKQPHRPSSFLLEYRQEGPPWRAHFIGKNLEGSGASPLAAIHKLLEAAEAEGREGAP